MGHPWMREARRCATPHQRFAREEVLGISSLATKHILTSREGGLATDLRPLPFFLSSYSCPSVPFIISSSFCPRLSGKSTYSVRQPTYFIRSSGKPSIVLMKLRRRGRQGNLCTGEPHWRTALADRTGGNALANRTGGTPVGFYIARLVHNMTQRGAEMCIGALWCP